MMENALRIVFIAAAVVLLSSSSTLGDSCKGCVDLDEFSFGKLVPKFKYALVKYDIAYPYGPKHDAFVHFAESLRSVQDIVAGNVGIKDYGLKDNADFALAQGVDSAKLPVIKLYMGRNDAVTYEDEELTIDKLQEFVVEHSDIHITLPGCVEVLDKLAAKFVHCTTEGDKQTMLQQVEEFETDVETEVKARKVYSQYMRKLLDDGDFIGKEQRRLKKILTDGKLSEAKTQDLQNKINILHAFESKNVKSTKEEL